MREKLKETFNNLDTVLNEKHLGKVSKEFIQLVDGTKEEIKNKEQLLNNLTVELSLDVDRAFDEYIEGKS
jgi:hypothetical protein